MHNACEHYKGMYAYILYNTTNAARGFHNPYQTLGKPNVHKLWNPVDPNRNRAQKHQRHDALSVN